MVMKLDIEELRVGMFVHLDLGWWAHPFALSSFLVTSPDQLQTIRGLGLKAVRWSPEKSRLNDPAVPQPPGAGDPAAAIGLPAATAAAPVAADAQPADADADADADAAAANAAPVPAIAAEGPVPTAAAAGALTAETTAAPTHAPAAAAAMAAPDAAANEATIQAAQVPAAAAGKPAAASPAEPPAAAPATGPQARLQAALSQQFAAQRLCEQQYREAGQAWHEAQRQVPKLPEQARQVTEGLTRALLDKLMVDREMCVRVISDAGGDRVSSHALNVTVISLLMARVFGFGEDDLLDLGLGALLHDVGKLDLPDRAHHAEGLASQADQLAYREHVALGLAHGRRMGLSDGALVVLAQHHEMADGSGFPARLNLDRMAIGARIVSLVNRYDNLCNPAKAAQSLTPHEALSLIFAQSRDKFDATMLNAFIRMMGVYPPGSVVQLTDDRYASVVSCNSSRPLKPRVLVCDTKVPVEEALLLNLDGQADLGIRRSLKPTQLPAAARDYLSPRQRMVYFFEPVMADLADAQEALAA
jgi:putative nucleotidyltransferase with HDIG domain